jgi:exonuclease III
LEIENISGGSTQTSDCLASVDCENDQLPGKGNESLGELADQSKTGYDPQNITFLSLNVCGLKSKLKGVEFENMLRKYDIVMLSETKLNRISAGSIDIPGFKFMPKNRSGAKAASGGVGVFIKDNLYQHCVELEGKCEFVLWLKCSLIPGKDILIGIVYIPPENSKYSDVKMFEDLENELVSLTAGKNLSKIIFGDLNSRTANLTDSVFLDNIISEAVDFSDEITQELFENQEIVTYSIDTQRYSQDNVSDKYGKRLLNMCRHLGIYILNGRVGCDKNIGHVTCRDKSVVDYVIASADIFQYVSDFCILPFDPMLSDVHNPISLTLKIPNMYDPNPSILNLDPNTEGLENAPKRPKWKPGMKTEFQDNCALESDVVLEVENTLTALEMVPDKISVVDVDNIVYKIRNIFEVSAGNCGFIKKGAIKKAPKNGVPKVGNGKRKLPHKPWFNANCENVRKDYYKAKKLYNLKPNADTKENLRTSSKTYKTQISKEYKLYHADLVNRIRNLKSSDPREYWTIVKDIEKNSKNDIEKNISIDVFTDHFRNLNCAEECDTGTNPSFVQEPHSGNPIDVPFTEKEILCVITNLKNNKACGMDRIVNEYLKSTPHIFISVYVKLFNIVLDTGIIPSDWTLGLIKPIYKNKGSKNDPDNYRGITILSCFGKLFTALINKRLVKFLEDTGHIGPEQAGFRKGYSTVDHIFTLHGLIQLYIQNGKRMYTCFVDFKKAFDSVNRTELWKKVLDSNIKGKMFNVIHNMYKHAKSRVSVGGNLSNSFPCNIGVRQGENLSPLLFAIFLNDLESFLSQHYKGLPSASATISLELEILLKLYILLYADDTVILAENAAELQKALSAMNAYCLKYKLEVNTTKTKVVIFSKGKVRKYPDFHFGNIELDVVGEYTYLGIIFNYNGKFNNAVHKLATQGTKAMYVILSKAQKLCLPIDIQLQLFDAMIKPILLYSSEVWGYQSLEPVEKVHRKFLKHILKVNSSTASCMVYGETGSFPLEVFVNQRMVCYWGRLITGPQNKFSVKMYQLMRSMSTDPLCVFPWLNKVKQILDNCGMSNTWETESFPNLTWLKESVLQNSKDQYIQNWLAQVTESNKCLNYKIFKNTFVLEPYLLELSDKLRNDYVKFRCRNSKFPIELGAHCNITRSERKCTLCQLNEVGDEFHYLFRCNLFSPDRCKLMKKYFWNNPSTYKMDLLLNSQHKQLVGPCRFI